MPGYSWLALPSVSPKGLHLCPAQMSRPSPTSHTPHYCVPNVPTVSNTPDTHENDPATTDTTDTFDTIYAYPTSLFSSAVKCIPNRVSNRCLQRALLVLIHR